MNFKQGHCFFAQNFDICIIMYRFVLLVVFLFACQSISYGQKRADFAVYNEKTAVYIQMADSSYTSQILSELSRLKLSVTKYWLPFNHTQSANLKRILRVEFESKAEALTAIEWLSKNNNLVELIELVPLSRSCYTPNDYKVSQWHLNKINALAGWNLEKGSNNIKIAIVDDAIDIDHPDLKSKCWKNTSEIPGNGIDDDKNGYIDDYDGWLPFYRSGNPRPPFNNRALYAHGTFCAGIAAAQTDNSIGVSSIGFNVSIIPIATFDSLNPGKIWTGYEGIAYAADAGADIISISWGSYTYSLIAQQVIDYASTKVKAIIAAAGNDNLKTPFYPAAYTHVIAVSATNKLDQKCGFSNFGTWIDVSAPGEGIESCNTGSSVKYVTLSGTSAASALVSGLAGLMLSRNPNLSSTGLENCLKKGSDNISSLNPLFTGQLGTGRINALNSINCVSPLYAAFVFSKIKLCENDTLMPLNSSSKNAVTYKWTVTGAIPATSNLKSPTFKFPNIGKYSVKLVVSDGVNYDSVVFQNIEVVQNTLKLTGNQTIVKNDAAILKAEFAGIMPWELTITDGIQDITYKNIQTDVFYFYVSPLVNTVYKVKSFIGGRCAAVGFDSVTIKVTSNSKKKCDTLGGSNVTQYTVSFDGGGNEIPHQIIQLRDSSFMLVGLTSAGKIGNDDIFLVKFDKFGKILWNKTYGSTKAEFGIPINLVESSNKEIHINGAQLNGSYYDGYIIKVDKNGKLVWSKKASGSKAHDHWRCGLSVGNGEIIVGGTSGINNLQAAAMMRIDSSGGIIWSKSHDQSSDPEHYLDVVKIGNCLYWIGGTPIGGGGYASIYSKTTVTGTNKFQKYVDFTYWDCFFSAISTANQNGIIAVGTTSNTGSSKYGGTDISLVHFDTFGAVVWSKIIGTSGNELISRIERKGSDYYLFGSTTGYDGGNSKLFVMKFDINGNVKWTNMYGKTGSKLYTGMFGKNIISDGEGGFLICGYQQNADYDIFLARINECGESNCTFTSVNFSISSLTPSITNANFIDNTILSSSTYATQNSIFNKTPVSKDVCSITPTVCKVNADFISSKSCAGDTLWFYDKSTSSANQKMLTTKWVFHDKSELNSNGVGHYVYNSSGSYSVTLIVFADTPNACSDTIVKTVVVNNNFKCWASAKPSKICIGDSSFLIGKVFCGKSPYKISWFPTSGLKNPSALVTSASPSASGWIKLKVTDALGTTAIDSVYLTVDKTCCRYNANISVSNPQLCFGGTAVLNNASNNSSGNAKWYIVSPTGKIDSSAQTNYGSYKPTQPGFYKVLLVWKGSCKPDTAFSGITCNPRPFAYAGRDSLICSPDSVSLGDIPVERYSYKWIPANGLSADTIANPVAWVTDSMQYIVSAKNLITGCTASDTVAVFIPDKPKLGNDTSICAGDSLYLTNPFAKATWENGQNTPKRTVKLPGNYILTLNLSGCTLADTIVLKNNALPKINLGNDTTLCQSQKIILGGAPVQNAKYKWTPGTNLSSDTVANPLANISDTAQYSVLVSDRKTGCQNRDTIRLFLPQKPVLGADTAFCKGDSVVIYNPMAGLAAWENGSKSFARTIKSPGLYRVILNAGKCALSDTIVVTEYPKPVFKITGDSAICNNKPVIVFPNIDTTGKKAFWMDNISVFKRNIAVPGKYVLTISQGKCVSADVINIVKTVTPSFDLGPDTTICLGVNYVLKVNTPYSKYSWNDGSKDSIKTVVKAGKYIVSVSNECGLLTDSVSIAYKNCICTILFPNTFTPDGNNRNDLFKAYPDCELFDYRLRIYSRWGEKLFDSRDVNTGWDGWYEGQMVPDGVYVYILDVKMYQNGVLNWENRKGTVTVLH